VTGAMPWVPDWRDFFVPLPGTVVLYGCYKNSEVKNGKFRIGQFIQAVPNLKTKHATVHADLFSED